MSGSGSGAEGAEGTEGVEAARQAPHVLCVLYVHFGGCAEEDYPGLLGLLAGFTPVVQALPPDAALADVRGALRYFACDAVGLAGLVRLRVTALHGAACTVGVAASRSRQVRGFLKAQDRELAGRPGPRRRSYGRLKRQGLVEAAFGRVW